MSVSATAVNTVIVTGASKGIGAACCRELRQQGIMVIGIARQEDKLKSLSNENGSVPMYYIAGDIRNDVTQERAIDLAIKDNRKLVGLILNAGTVQPLSRISALWDKQDIIDAFDINVFSNLSLIRRALPHLRKFGGRILATTSGVVQVPLMGWSIYTSSKTALNSIIEILAKEEANSGIASIVAMEPGIVDTEMFREAAGMPTETLDPDYVSWIKNVQLLKPEEPAESMAKLILKAPKEKSGKYISWNEPWIKEL